MNSLSKTPPQRAFNWIQSHLFSNPILPWSPSGPCVTDLGTGGHLQNPVLFLSWFPNPDGSSFCFLSESAHNKNTRRLELQRDDGMVSPSKRFLSLPLWPGAEGLCFTSAYCTNLLKGKAVGELNWTEFTWTKSDSELGQPSDQRTLWELGTVLVGRKRKRGTETAWFGPARPRPWPSLNQWPPGRDGAQRL
jgi:hypothetical protein